MKSIEQVKKELLIQSPDLEKILTAYDVNSVDEYGSNILHYYIKYVSSIDISADKFIYAVKKKGINLDAKQTKREQLSALHLAILTKNKLITELLLSEDIIIDTTDANGNTPLFKAVFNYRNDDPFFIKYLCEKGANVNLKNNHDVSPIDLAERISNYDSLIYLKPISS